MRAQIRDSCKRMQKGRSAFLCLKSKPNSILGPNIKVKVKLSHISTENTKMNGAVSGPQETLTVVEEDNIAK